MTIAIATPSTPALAQAASKSAVVKAVRPNGAVQIFDRNGRQIRKVPSSAIARRGPSPWDPDYDLVEIADGEWVDSAMLELTFCDKPIQQPGISSRRDDNNRRLENGSGTGCPQ